MVVTKYCDYMASHRNYNVHSSTIGFRGRVQLQLNNKQNKSQCTGNMGNTEFVTVASQLYE